MSDNGPDTPPIAHKWDPIEDLPNNWRDLCRPDLQAVHRQWVAESKLIKDEEKLKKFQEELDLLWAIETGLIERLYRFDRGVTVQILDAGLEALGQHHASGLIGADAEALIADQRAALDMVMDLIGSQRELTPFYIKELHQRLTLNQATRDVLDQSGDVRKQEWPASEKGAWKKWPNNPLQPDGSIHEYCPPEQVDSEIERLLALHERHKRLDVCPEVEAAWLHHRFTQIHPFQDGNGRVARALTGAVFLKGGSLVLVIRDEEHRERYLAALQAADKGDLTPLVDLFADVQRDDLESALKIIRGLRGEASIQAIETAAAAARQSQDSTTGRLEGALDELIRVASVRFEEIAAETQRAFESQGVVVSAVVSSGDAHEASVPREILEVVQRYGYIDPERPSRWVSLRLGLPARSDLDIRLVIALYPAGTQPRRYAASEVLCAHPRDDGEWTSRSTSGSPLWFDVHPSDSEALEAFAAEFREWLEEKITQGLQGWAASL